MPVFCRFKFQSFFGGQLKMMVGCAVVDYFILSIVSEALISSSVCMIEFEELFSLTLFPN